MSDTLKHECGVAMLRLRGGLPGEHPGLRLLSLLLGKQHNRGQDGAGIAIWKSGAAPGSPYFRIEKSAADNPLADVLERLRRDPFDGEMLLGHLRYGTYGGSGTAACHPLEKTSIFRDRALLLAGNFNLTNSERQLKKLIRAGCHPAGRTDTSVLLAAVGFELEKDPKRPLAETLREAAAGWDGGFLICGMIGDGTGFVLRDPAGIRPGFYCVTDAVAAVASERPAIQTTLDVAAGEIREIPPGHLLTMHRDGRIEIAPCLPERPARKCVFERIYFSRGNDADIQSERRQLGALLIPHIAEAIRHDWENTFISCIPNTARTCFQGALGELRGHPARFGELVVKDVKFRTFIADSASRRQLDMHVYDLIYGLIRPGRDRIVLFDDSIVRGNTIRRLLLKLLDRLEPRQIVIASSAPPVCYPDCYGIDMASLGELVAFQAAVSVLEKTGRSEIIEQCVHAAESDLRRKDHAMRNRVKPIYDAVGFDALCREIGVLLTPPELRSSFQAVFQPHDNLRAACPGHTGDWYFSGDYPTPGGNRVVNRALLHYHHHINRRAYA